MKDKLHITLKGEDIEKKCCFVNFCSWNRLSEILKDHVNLYEGEGIVGFRADERGIEIVIDTIKE